MLSRRGLTLLTRKTFQEQHQLIAPCAFMVQQNSAGVWRLTRAFRIVPREQQTRNAVADDYIQMNVFEKKSTRELIRSFVVLKASSVNAVAKYSEQAFLLGEKLVWRPLFERIMRMTFYGQFAAGESVELAKEATERLKEANIRSILFVPIEAPTTNQSQQQREAMLESNYQSMQDCINGTALLEWHGFSQLKITALCEKKLLLKINKHLLAYGVDHREPGGWDIETISKHIQNEEFHKIHISDLSEATNEKLRELLRRLDLLTQQASDLNVRLLIDAEQTYLQASLNYLILLLQSKYNKINTTVYNTYQCYRKDTLDRVKADKSLGDRLGFKIAGKLVRGAYMNEERRLALEGRYADPINESYEATTDIYHSVVSYVMPEVAKQQIGVMIASHNEDTVEYVKKCIEDFGIEKDSQSLCFGQILGMCDHVSYHLGQEGYVTYKSVPYGSIGDTLLYLSRRAHENQSVLRRTAFELLLIKKELKRRMLR